MIFQRLRFEPAEHAVAVLGEPAQVAVELLIPVGEGAELGQMLDLIDVAGAHAAAIGFLQGDQIVTVEQLADALEVAGAPRMRQQMLPATGQVVMVTLGADAHLDVEAEQTQAAIGRQSARRQAMRVDLRLARACQARRTPAAQHGRLPGSAFFFDEEVGDFQRTLWTTGRADVETVLAIDDHHRHAGDLVGHAELLGLFGTALHAEGVEGLEERLAIDAVAGDQISHLLRRFQLIALIVIGVEHGIMHRLLDVHRFQSQEQLSVQVPGTAEHGRNALEIHVVRQLLDPWVDDRFELVAMRAAVPEQLHHLDLARISHRHRRLQFDVFLAGLELCRLDRQAEQAGGNDDGTEHEFTHGDSLDYERLTNSGTGCSKSASLASALRRLFNILTSIVAAPGAKKGRSASSLNALLHRRVETAVSAGPGYSWPALRCPCC